MNRTVQSFCAVGVLALAACANPSSSGDASALDEPELNTASASIVMPLIDEKKQLLSRWNAQAKAKGLNELPDTVEIKTAADAQKLADLRDYFEEHIMEAVGAKSGPMPAWGPESFTSWSKTSKVPGLCYKGNPAKVIDVIQSGTDTAFSDQLVIQGWRYKTAKHFSDGNEEYEDSFPDVWKDWRGTGTALLVVSSQSDGGDDLNPAVIPRCTK